MPKKSRTPPPPRRVQAPTRRTQPRQPRATKKWLAVAAGAVVLAAAAGGIAYALSRGGGEAGATPCTVQTVEAQGQQHVPPAEMPEGFEYNTFPPTSGPHHPEPLVFAEYTNPVPQNRLIHNLEHGGVFVQYGDEVSDATIQRLTEWYREDPRGIVLAPLPDRPEAEELADKIVLGAWTAEREREDDPTSPITSQQGRLAVCSSFDGEAFDDFISDYRARGPELFTLDQLEPGSQ